MENTNRLLLRSAAAGGGFAIVVGIIVGLAMWFMSRPAKPKPWNHEAITASYETVVPIKDGSELQFSYTLENHTTSDYRVGSEAGIHMGAQLARSNSVNFDKNGRIAIAYPIFVPAKGRVLFTVTIPYPYSIKKDSNASPDEKHDYDTKAAQYVANELNNLNGFVLMDDGIRYEIDLPNGWAKRAKEPLRIKVPK